MMSRERHTVPMSTAAESESRVVGRLRLASPQRDYPHSTWRIVLSDPHVAPVVAGLLGSRARPRRGDGIADLVTDTVEIELLLASADAIRISWHHGMRRCDGVASADPACTCPAGFAARKRTAWSGRGCVPRVQVLGRLACAPHLGIFEFVSGNWRFAEEAAVVTAALRQRRAPAHAVLGLARSDHTLPSGRRVLDTRASLTLRRLRARKAPHGSSRPPRPAKKSA
jgi:hypothetical protein